MACFPLREAGQGSVRRASVERHGNATLLPDAAGRKAAKTISKTDLPSSPVSQAP